MQIVVLLLMVPAFYFLLIRPQQKKLKEHQELIASLEVGDDVMTTGGIYGQISLIDGEVILLDVADEVQLRVARSAVAELVEYEDPDGDEDADAESGRG
jgi:preprotein translocase subunit YajC